MRRLPRTGVVGRFVEGMSLPHVPTWAEVVLAAFALAAGVWLAQRQIDLADKQLELMLKQDEILMRRAELAMRAQPIGPFDSFARILMFVENNGSRGAGDFFCISSYPRTPRMSLRGTSDAITRE